MKIPIPELPDLPYTLKEVAAMLRKSVKTVRRLISDGHLLSLKIGGSRHVLASELQKYLDRQIAKGKGESHA